MLLVYIASPYTTGSKPFNVNRQMEMAHRLLDYGYCPVWPLAAHYLEQMRERTYDEWLEMDFALVARCDALIRLEGESEGADREMSLARSLGIPVVHSVEELIALETIAWEVE